jgi:hypothetical protein
MVNLKTVTIGTVFGITVATFGLAVANHDYIPLANRIMLCGFLAC